MIKWIPLISLGLLNCAPKERQQIGGGFLESKPFARELDKARSANQPSLSTKAEFMIRVRSVSRGVLCSGTAEIHIMTDVSFQFPKAKWVVPV